MLSPLPPCFPVFQLFPDSDGGAVTRSLRRSLPRLIQPPAVLLPTLVLVFSGAEPARAGQTDIPALPSGLHSGVDMQVLPNGNIVVLYPNHRAPGVEPATQAVGAVCLYNGATLQPMGVLTGTTPGDQVGSKGITVLPNGGFLIHSPLWDNGTAVDAGAVTWCSGTDALPSEISAENSLVGGSTGDLVGDFPIRILKNGNYVVQTYSWDHGAVADAGAVTWGSAATGVRGLVSPANSLTGASAGEHLHLATALENGHYVVSSPGWDNGTAADAGAVIWCSGVTGRTGVVSAADALTGTTAGDGVGWSDGAAQSVIPLANGHYMVASVGWDHGAAVDAGAVTWCSGTGGRTGPVSSANSLVGTHKGDRVGSTTFPPGIIQLGNGHCLARSTEWNGQRGALTWISGNATTAGEVSPENSLVGISWEWGVTTGLRGGGYLVHNYQWNNGRGAVTWGSGNSGVSGEVSAANSLVGDSPRDWVGIDGVKVLSNGHYIVASSRWTAGPIDDGTGAVTWGAGDSGVTGEVSAENSLVGTPNREASVGDGVGQFTVPLNDRHYAVCSPGWDRRRGAVTLCNAAAGTRGYVSAENSLTGAGPYAAVGDGPFIPLANGNYVINSLQSGAVTWIPADKPVTGTVSEANSLFIRVTGAGPPGCQVTPLSNGNYVVSTPWWGTAAITAAGSVTWCSGTEGRTGMVSPENSLTGDMPYDMVGSLVTELANGNYTACSNVWGSGRGAVTWCSGITGRTGTVSAENSLVGTTSWSQTAGGDRVGSFDVTALPGGNYVVVSTGWNGGRGAVTWGDGTTGTTGPVSAVNSLTGSRPDDAVGSGDMAGEGRITLLTNGNYVVHSSLWHGSRGAVTWGSGTTGVRGEVSEANSLVGLDIQGGNYVWVDALGGGGYRVDGKATPSFRNRLILGDGWSGTRGTVTDAISLVPPDLDGVPADFWTSLYDAPNSRLLAVNILNGQLSLLGYVPEMAVRSGAWTGTSAGTAPVPHGQTVPDAGNGTDFGEAAATRESVERVFTILNSGMEPLHLTGAPVVAVEGPDAADFTVSVSALPASGAVAAAGGTAEFRITFRPSAPGLRRAVVRIPNDDRDESGYQFAIQGTGVDPDGGGGDMVLAVWRAQYFGNAAAGTGHLDDFDSDGVVNLLEFAFGTHPAGGRSGDGEGGADGGGAGVNSGPDALRYSGSLTEGGGTLIATGQPLLARLEDGSLTALFIGRKDRTRTGLEYTPQFTPDPSTAAAWTVITTTPKVLAEDGLYEVVSVPLPAPAAGAAGFFRVGVEGAGRR